MATILVVDDVAQNVALLERGLRRLGYEVISALSGAQALALAEERQPDVILLDVLMPELDGIAVCRRLKATPGLQAIPVILVSALAHEQHVVRGLDAGAVDYLTKPVNDVILAARVRSALRIKEAYDTMQAAAQLGSEFLAATGDELRTPLANILEFADSLLGPDRSEEERRAAIDNIRHSGGHLLQIIDEMRELSEIQAARAQVEFTGCSPVDIVAEVATLVHRHARTRGLELTLEYAGPVPEKIHSAPVLLRRILLSLLTGVLRFTETEHLELRTEFIPREGSESRLQFEVADSGVAMCDQEFAKLFRPFGQVDPSTIVALGTAGLGLTLCNQLVELLGGDFFVAYAPGKGLGTRIRVPTGALDGVALLDQPRASQVGSTGDIERDEYACRLEGCRVLVAEDDPATCKSISGLLARAGAEITAAVNGPAAVGLVMAADAAGSPFDVVLVEMHLSVLDGDAAVDLLRRRGYSRPIIGLTAAAVEGRQRSGAAGCDDVVLKPIDPSRLITAIRGQLTTRRVQGRSTLISEARG